MTPRMNMNRAAVVRFIEAANESRSKPPFPTASDIAWHLGFETTDRARTHIRYAEWAGWIERISVSGQAMTYRVTAAGRLALSEGSGT